MESIGGDLGHMAPRPFAAAHLAAIRAIATERRYAAGEMLLEVGEPQDYFVHDQRRANTE